MKGENGIIKEVVIIDAIYNFILKDNTSNQLMLFKTTMNKNIDNKQKEDNTNKIMKIESKIIDKKFFEKNINFIDGIIFTYNSQEQNNYENTIKFILEIEEKNQKVNFYLK